MGERLGFGVPAVPRRHRGGAGVRGRGHGIDVLTNPKTTNTTERLLTTPQVTLPIFKTVLEPSITPTTKPPRNPILISKKWRYLLVAGRTVATSPARSNLAPRCANSPQGLLALSRQALPCAHFWPVRIFFPVGAIGRGARFPDRLLL